MTVLRLSAAANFLLTIVGLGFLATNVIVPQVHAAGESISGFVYEDTNGNNSFDSGTETGVSGLTVNLYTTGLAFVGTTTTTAGNYTFDETNALTISSGVSYYVYVTPPSLVEYSFSQGQYQTLVAALTPGEERILGNYGIFNKNFFYGRPFYDSNRDGVRQDGETYSSNLEVVLENSSFEQIAGPAAAGMGGYGIVDEVTPPGTYYIRVINLPSTFVFTDQNVGADESRDSDVGSDGRIPVTITYGTNYSNLDIGFYRANVLAGGKVFSDLNSNGIEDDGENGISNIHIDAINRETGSSIGDTTTDSSGEYQISYAPPTCVENISWTNENSLDIPCPVITAGGYYQLEFTMGSHCEVFQTEVELLAANGDQLYHDSCGIGGTLNSEQSYSMLLSTPESRTGFAHLNFINRLDPFMEGEAHNITLTYINVSLNFNNLTPGQNFTDSNVGMDDTIDSDVITPDGDTAVLFAGAGDVLENIDAGLRVTGGGGGGGECETGCGRFRLHIFTDTNGNGIQDSGEPNSASGTTLTLSLGVMSHTDVPDVDGNIEVEIDPATYTLTINPPSGALITGGSNPIIVIVTAEELNDLGARGIYLSPISSGARNGSGGGAIGSGILRTAQGVTLYAPPLPGNTTEIAAIVQAPAQAQIALNPRKPCLVIGGAQSQKFNDVTSTANLDLISSIVIKDTQSKLIQGYGNGNFGPTRPLTRFELLKVALTSNCIGSSNNNPHPNTVFSDVPQDNSELSLIIGEAYARGIIKGIDGKFFPNAPVTQAEMLKMLLGASTYFVDGNPTAPLPITIKGLTDTSFAPYIQKAYQLGLFTLPKNQLFQQDAIVDRALMIDTLAPFIKVIQANLAVS